MMVLEWANRLEISNMKIQLKFSNAIKEKEVKTWIGYVCTLCELHWTIGCDVDREMRGRGCGTCWRLISSNFLGVIAIQTIDIFLRGCYLKYPDFLSQAVRSWLGLKSVTSSHAWAQQAASVKAKLRIYPGTLPFVFQHSLNQVNDWRKVEVLGF